MFEGVSKKLIIVGDKDSDVYCEFMSMLISSKDDKKESKPDERIVGVEDGSVDSAIWTDEIYRDNRAHTSSKQKILFIGETDASKNIMPNLAFFDGNAYGVKIGWLGNKAAIAVNYDAVKDEETYKKFYDEYIQLIRSYNPNILKDEAIPADGFLKKLNQKVNVILPGKEKTAHDDSAEDSIEEPEEESKAKRILKKVGKTAGIASAAAVFAPVAAIAMPFSVAVVPVAALATAAAGGLPVASALAIKDAAQRKKVIVDQQYRYGVLKFYLAYLQKFIFDEEE